jgi:hypothetical protein
MLLICILFFSSFVIILSTPVLGQDFEFGTNIRINDDSGTKAQRTPDIAVSDNGNIYIVWSDDRNNNKDIFISKSTDDGKLFGDQTENNDIRVDNDQTGASQQNPAIASYNNDIYVVWSDDRSGFYHIYFAKSTDDGATFSGHLKIDTLQNQDVCDFPDIAVNPSDGKISVVWQFDNKIYYAESENGGTSFSASSRVDPTSQSYIQQKYPKVAVGSSGDKYVVWEDNRSGPGDFDVYFATATSASTTFGGYKRVDEGTTNTDGSRVAIAASGSSNVYVVWRDERDGTTGDIYFDKSSDKGSTWGTDKRLESSSKGSHVQDRPTIELDSSNNIHVAWEDKRNNDYQIYYVNSTDGGSTFGTNLRVDDAQTEINGREPSIATGGKNKVYITWKDNRNLNTDIYFSRWGIAGQTGYPPSLSDIKLSPTIGGIGDDFTWEVTYTDLDNDEVDPLYPKLHIYTDKTKSTEISGSPFKMDVVFADQSKLPSMGKRYLRKVTLKEDHDYRYLIDIKAVTGDTSIITSNLKTGPDIDSTPPTYSKPKPSSTKWHNTESITCEITITDPGGSGVARTKTQYQYMTNSSDEYSRFFTNPKSSQIADGYEFNTTITFKEGAENFIRWNTTDLVGSGELGYVWSDTYEIKIDTLDVTFTDPVPLDINWQNSESVICGITINDFGGSGVNGSTIKYYYLPAGTVNYIGPFSASVDMIAETIKATTPTGVQFNNGPGNYIKWEAKDLAGNKLISDAFEVNIDTSRPDNTPPRAPAWIKPADSNDKTPTIEWDKGSDADGDELTYFLQIGTFQYGDDVLALTSTGTNNFYIIKSDLLIGTYYIQVQAFDDWDYSPIVQRTMNITATSTNKLPSPPTGISPEISTSNQPLISWEGATDEDGDTIMYYIQIGTASNSGDVLPWAGVGRNSYYTPLSKLADGIYYVQIMSYDGTGTSAPYEELLKIATFEPELEVPTEATAITIDGQIKVKIELLNNGTMSDNITINITGNLVGKSSVTFELSPKTPIMLNANQSKTITVTIKYPPQITAIDYHVDFQAISEDGESKSFSRSLIIHMKSKPPKQNGDNGGTGGDDGDDGFDLGSILPLIILLIVVVVIIVVIAGVVSYSRKKKKDEKAKQQFFQEQNDYEKLYGTKENK